MAKKKFYKKAQAKEVKELPNNSRSIPEKLMSDHLVFFAGAVCIGLAIVVVGLSLWANYQNQKVLGFERAKLQREINFWEKEINEKPGYRDAYFSVAVLYYQLNNFEKASNNLEKALIIDPNFEKGKELKLIIDNN